MRIHLSAFTLIIALLTLVMYGCSTPMNMTFDTPNYQKQSWSQRKSHLLGRQSWNIQGAVSIQVKGKTQMGSFAWQQRRQHFAIQIYGPLNLGSIALQGGPEYVSLWKSGSRYSAATPEALMQQQLGWYLPISNLFYWVRGLPAPGIPAKEIHDRFGHLVSLQQQNWQIDYQAYQSTSMADLPRKIYLNSQDIHAKLVIKHWNLME